jgi:hypothetical protein
MELVYPSLTLLSLSCHPERSEGSGIGLKIFARNGSLYKEIYDSLH